MSSAANPSVRHYRFCTPITGAAHEAYALVGSEDTSFEITLDTDYCIILKVGNTGDMSSAGDFQLQYNVDGAGWNDVNATSSNVRSAASGDTEDATSTTERLGTSAETFQTSVLDEVEGLIGTNLGGHDEYEFYFAINFRSAELGGGESIEFRLLTGGSTFTHSVTPTATVPAGAIAASPALVFSAAADLKAEGKLDATAALVFAGSTVDLEGKGKLDATAALVFSQTADLQSTNLNAAAALIFSAATALLKGTGLLAATAALAFSATADLTNATPPAGTQTDVYPLRSVEWTEKPPEGTPINFAHPMAEGLIFFCAMDRPGNQIDLVHNKRGTFTEQGSAVLTTQKQTQYGLVVNQEFGTTSDDMGFVFGDTGGTGYYEPTKLTIITRVRPGDEDDAGGSRIVSKRTTSVGNDDWAVYMLTDTAANDKLAFKVNGSDDNIIRTSGDWQGVLIDVAMSVDATEQNQYVWEVENGLFQSLLGQTGAVVDQSSGNLATGHRDGENRSFDGEIHYVAIWDRPQTQTFIEDFRRNPWQIFEHRQEPLLIESVAPPAVGAIDATAALVFSAAADLKARGKLDATAALVFSATADLEGLGKLDATAALTFTATAGLEGKGKLDATAALVFTATADLKAKGKLDASSALAFSVVANISSINRIDATAALIFGAPTVDLEGKGKLDATAALVFGAPTVNLESRGKLDATTALVFSTTADLKAQGKLDATAALVFSATADLKGKGKLDGGPALVFSATADLKDAIEGAISATAALVFGGTANLEGTGKLDAAAALAFSATADLEGKGKLDASPALAFSATADLEARGKLDATAALVFSATADLKAQGKLDATAPLVFGGTADLEGSGKLDATAVMVFSATADLVDATPVGAVSATAAMVFGGTADLGGGGKLDAAATMVFSATADLEGLGKLDATAALIFTQTADLKARGKLGATAALVFSATAGITAEGKLDASPAMAFTLVADLTDAAAIIKPFYDITISSAERDIAISCTTREIAITAAVRTITITASS